MKIRKTLTLAAAFSFVFASALSPRVTLAAIDAFLDFTPPPPPPKTTTKASPVSNMTKGSTKTAPMAGPASGSSGGGGGHHK